MSPARPEGSGLPGSWSFVGGVSVLAWAGVGVGIVGGLAGLADPVLGGLLLMAGAAVALVAFAVAWIQSGGARIPTVDDSVLMPQPPPELTPSMATVLLRDHVDGDALTTALVDLGNRGLIAFSDAPPSGEEAAHVAQLKARRWQDTPLTPDWTDSVMVEILQPPGVGDGPAPTSGRPLARPEAKLLELLRELATGSPEVDAAHGYTGSSWISIPFFDELGATAVASGWFRDNPYRSAMRWWRVGFAIAAIAIVLEVALVVGLGIPVIDQSITTAERFVNVALWAHLQLVLVGPIVLATIAGWVIYRLADRLPARTRAGAEELAMVLAYQNTLRHVVDASRSVEEALQGMSRLLPWVATPDELKLWQVALALDKGPNRMVERALFWVASEPGGPPPTDRSRSQDQPTSLA